MTNINSIFSLLASRLSLIVFGRILINFQAALLGIVLAGLFSKVEFGLLQQLTAAVMIVMALTKFGTEILAQYSIAEKQKYATELAKQFVIFKLLLGISIIPFLYIYLAVVGINHDFDLVPIVALYLFAFFLSINRFISNGLLIFLDRIKVSVISLNVSAFLKFTLILLMYIFYSLEIHTVILIYAGAEAVLCLYLLNKVNKKTNSYHRYSDFVLEVKKNSKHALLNYQDEFLSLLMSMYGGVFVLSFSDDLQLIASYTFIMSIIQAVFFGASLNSTLEQLMTSTLLRLKFKSSNRLNESELINKLGAWAALSTLVNLFYAVILFYILTLLNSLWLSDQYTSEIHLISLLYIGLSLLGWQYHYNAYAVVVKRLDLVRNAGFLGGVIHFSFLIFLVPKFGLLGALFGFLISCIVRWVYLHIMLGRPQILISGVRFLILQGSYGLASLGLAVVALMFDPKGSLILSIFLITLLLVVTIRNAISLRPEVGI